MRLITRQLNEGLKRSETNETRHRIEAPTTPTTRTTTTRRSVEHSLPCTSHALHPSVRIQQSAVRCISKKHQVDRQHRRWRCWLLLLSSCRTRTRRNREGPCAGRGQGREGKGKGKGREGEGEGEGVAVHQCTVQSAQCPVGCVALEGCVLL